MSTAKCKKCGAEIVGPPQIVAELMRRHARWHAFLAKCGGRQADAEALLRKQHRYEWLANNGALIAKANWIFAGGYTPKPTWHRTGDNLELAEGGPGRSKPGFVTRREPRLLVKGIPKHSAQDATILTISACEKALSRPSIPTVDRDSLLDLGESAMKLHRETTLKQVEAVRHLDRKLTNLEPGEKATEIQLRLGIRKSRYYQLRKLSRRAA